MNQSPFIRSETLRSADCTEWIKLRRFKLQNYKYFICSMNTMNIATRPRVSTSVKDINRDVAYW